MFILFSSPRLNYPSSDPLNEKDKNFPDKTALRCPLSLIKKTIILFIMEVFRVLSMNTADMLSNE